MDLVSSLEDIIMPVALCQSRRLLSGLPCRHGRLLVSGVYTAVVDLSAAAVSGDGVWSVTIVNGYVVRHLLVLIMMQHLR